MSQILWTHGLYFKAYRMCWICLKVSMLIMASGNAKDLGRYGESFKITEENLLHVIQNKLRHLEQTGEIAKHNQELLKRVEHSFRNPQHHDHHTAHLAP